MNECRAMRKTEQMPAKLSYSIGILQHIDDLSRPHQCRITAQGETYLIRSYKKSARDALLSRVARGCTPSRASSRRCKRDCSSARTASGGDGGVTPTDVPARSVVGVPEHKVLHPSNGAIVPVETGLVLGVRNRSLEHLDADPLTAAREER